MKPPGTTNVAISPSTIRTIASMRTGAIARLVPAPRTGKRRNRRRVYPRRVRQGWVRIGGPALFVVGSVVMVAPAGIPTAKDRLLVWLLLGLIAFSLVDARRLLPRLVLEWSPFIGFLLAYDLLRGVADSPFEAHVYPQLHVDEWLFGGSVPTVWLQNRFWHGELHIHWWDYVAWLVELTQFFAEFVPPAVLWRCAHARSARYATIAAPLAALGFPPYVLSPAVPPWLASERGALAP